MDSSVATTDEGILPVSRMDGFADTDNFRIYELTNLRIVGLGL